MSDDLQHARLAELCAELRLQAVPAAYGALAQAASERDTPYAVFLEEVLRAEREARRTRHGRCSLGLRGSRR